MTVQERALGDVTILDVNGRMTVDAPRDARLVDTVRCVLAEGRRQILVNMEQVPQIDSSGLCDLVTAYTSTVRQGGALKLVKVPARVRDLLEITRILPVIEAYRAEADAVASFARVSS